MLDADSVRVELVNVDAGKARVIGIVVEQVQKIHVGKHVVADGDDPVHDHPCASALPGNLAEKLAECRRTVRNERIVLNVSRTEILGGGDDATLAVAVSGEFPGSPVTLDYMFRLQNNKILLLTIA